MANGRELSVFRQKILSLLIHNKHFAELLLDQAVIHIDDSDIQDEILKYLLPYSFISETQEDASSYVTFELSSKVSKIDYYKDVSLIFLVYAHCSKVRMPNGLLRTDLLCEIIQDTFNDNKDFGLGRMLCVNDAPYQPNYTHYGRRLEFVVKEKNMRMCK